MGIFGDYIVFTPEEEAALDAILEELAPQFAAGPAPHPARAAQVALGARIRRRRRHTRHLAASRRTRRDTPWP